MVRRYEEPIEVREGVRDDRPPAAATRSGSRGLRTRRLRLARPALRRAGRPRPLAGASPVVARRPGARGRQRRPHRCPRAAGLAGRGECRPALPRWGSTTSGATTEAPVAPAAGRGLRWPAMTTTVPPPAAPRGRQRSTCSTAPATPCSRPARARRSPERTSRPSSGRCGRLPPWSPPASPATTDGSGSAQPVGAAADGRPRALRVGRVLRGGRRPGAATGHSAREADDLLRQSEIFLDLVCRSLGLPVSRVAPRPPAGAHRRPASTPTAHRLPRLRQTAPGRRMSTEFAHLHVASGFSMRYGTAQPEALVERAAQHRQPILALTDRDGLYGAVRFVQAATAAGIAPVLGVDLAVGPDAARPARRGPARPTPLPRATPPGRRSAGAPSATRATRGSPSSPGAGRPGCPPGWAGRRCAGWSPRPTCGGSAGCR